MMDDTQSKLVAVVALGIGSIFVGLLPVCFTKQSRKQWPLFLSSLLCFGGGVLLATSLVHILPEARETARDEYKSYTELFLCAGFFLLYLMDEVVHFFYGEMGHSHGENRNVREIMNRAPEQNYLRRHSANSTNYSYRAYGATERQALLGADKQLPYNPSFIRAHSDSVLFCDEPPSQLCHVGHREPCQSAIPTTNFGLLVALSIHSLLEGLIVGLEELPSQILLLLGAIASHKLVVGFCLGVELASNAHITFCKHFTCILVFAGSSVGGIFLGMAISDVPSDVTDIVIPILQALAGGTLLYVTVSEVLPRERARWHQQHTKRSSGVIQLISVLLGFLLMTVFIKYLDHH